MRRLRSAISNKFAIALKHFPFSAALGYEQMNLFMLSLARKFGLHENSGYRLQWLVISEWFQQAPRGVCTMLKVCLLVQTMFREGAPSGGCENCISNFHGG